MNLLISIFRIGSLFGNQPDLKLRISHFLRYMDDDLFIYKQTPLPITIHKAVEIWTELRYQKFFLRVCEQVRFKVHYENMFMQYTVIFHGCKNDNFQLIFFFYFFHFFLLKT